MIGIPALIIYALVVSAKYSIDDYKEKKEKKKQREAAAAAQAQNNNQIRNNTVRSYAGNNNRQQEDDYDYNDVSDYGQKSSSDIMKEYYGVDDDTFKDML